MAQLTEEDRDAVAAGRMTLTELAAARGITKQAVSAAFRRRGWSARPVESRPKTRAKPARAARTPAKTRAADPATNHHPGTENSPTAAQLPADTPFADLTSDDDDSDEAAEAIKGRMFRVAQLVLAQAEHQLVSAVLGPSALKAVAQAAELAYARCEKILEHEAAGVPTMVIREMTAERQQAIRDQAEADYHSQFPHAAKTEPAAGNFDGDDGNGDEDSSPEPLEPGQDEQEPSPGTILTVNGNDASRPPQAPSAAHVASLAARLQSAHANGQVGRFQLQTFATALGLGKSRDAEQLMRTLIDAATCDITAYQHIDHELHRQLKALSERLSDS